MHNLDEGIFQLNKLSLRGQDVYLDPLSTRLRISSMLNAMQLRPAGLPPSAIVFINKLKDPMPGKLHLRSGGMFPLSEWEQAVNDSIARIIRNAARPAHEAVPANAEAVVFTDKAELLACLARDWCEGNIVTRWWWKSLYRVMDVSQAVLNAWLEAPEYVPAALEHLSKERKIIPFIQRLSPGESKMLLKSIIHSFALYAMESAISAVLDNDSSDIRVIEPGIDNSERSRAERGKSSENVIVHPHPNPPPSRGRELIRFADKYSPSTGGLWLGANGSKRRGLGGGGAELLPENFLAYWQSENPPWDAWVPESDDVGTEIVHQFLVGVGLMLIRAPAVVRSTSFAQSVLQWYRAVAIDRGSMRKVTFVTPLEQNLPSARERVIEKTYIAKTIRSKDNISPSYREADPGIEQHAESDSRTKEALSFPIVKPEEGLVATADVSPLFEESIETEYGGIFYLINLGIFLGLYGDFTTPRSPGISLSIWDFIALAGMRIAGPKIKSDPVWSLLARLTGRNEHQDPGQDFDPPDQWRLPNEWLRAFPEESIWRWNIEGGRLNVKHYEEFPVLDLEAEDDPVAQLMKATEDYRTIVAFELEQDNSLGTSEYNSAPDRWMGWIMPYIKARLIRALGLTGSDDLTQKFCECHARIAVTPTHLDVFFLLNELPIEIRLSGLDRNPGWVPAAGRFIQFHFE